MKYRDLSLTVAIPLAAACWAGASEAQQAAPNAPAAVAQAAPALDEVNLSGTITAITPSEITIKERSGASTTLPLGEGYTVIFAKPVDIEAIRPGMNVATANTNIDATSGRSTEVRMIDEKLRRPEFSRAMGRPNTTMTNGTVRTITTGAEGHELAVTYPGGSRKIIVPPGVPVVGQYPATPADLKPGVMVNILGTPAARPSARRITIPVPR
jgi:hypothetical protein